MASEHTASGSQDQPDNGMVSELRLLIRKIVKQELSLCLTEFETNLRLRGLIINASIKPGPTERK